MASVAAMELTVDGDLGRGPLTLAVDVGASKVKATVLDAEGRPATAARRRRVVYPCSPGDLVVLVRELADALPRADRVGLGFPGVLRGGRVLTATNLVTASGPGSPDDPTMVVAWDGVDLVGMVAEALGLEVRGANDADLVALAVAAGEGVELVVTLGSGFGSGLVVNGELAAHLELGSMLGPEGEDLDRWVGEAARKDLGDEAWEGRVVAALDLATAITTCDRLYVGGGNARRLSRRRLATELACPVEVVASGSGLLGASRLFAAG